MSSPAFYDLEDFVIALYSALTDALVHAGVSHRNGKLISRPGPAPDVDDLEILCITILQEILGFESDNGFYDWFQNHPLMDELFPRKLSRQNYADRRAILTPLMQKLCQAFCALGGEAIPPFALLTPIRSMSAAPFEPDEKCASADWHKKATVVH